MAKTSRKSRARTYRRPQAETRSSVDSTEQASDRRRFKRAASRVKVSLSLAGRLDGMRFEAVLPSRDVSLGGIFLESEFFLALGTRMRVTFELPDSPEPIEVEGLVAREERQSGRSGFAIRFIDMDGLARQSLASHFLAPEVREFVRNYRSRVPKRAGADETAMAVDLLVAWELDRLDRGRVTSL